MINSESILIKNEFENLKRQAYVNLILSFNKLDRIMFATL